MKVKEIMKAVSRNQNVLIVADDMSAGFYRYVSEDVPPTLCKRDVVNVYAHSNGKELVIETK